MHSCIYEGIVTHRRRDPVVHQFRYRLFMIYLDLGEIPLLVGKNALIADRRFALHSFLRTDHLFDSQQTLADELRGLIRSHTGLETRGPIRLLTQLRYFGHFMSPLNLFYVYDESDQRVECIVAEVHNTPWNERHCYVLWNGNRTFNQSEQRFVHEKAFHVSPFMDMQMQYRWQLSCPAESVSVSVANYQANELFFDACMTLARRNLTRSQLRRMCVRYPFMTARITSGIYYQAWKLWWKKCPFFTHPNKRNQSPPTPPAGPDRRQLSMATRRPRALEQR